VIIIIIFWTVLTFFLVWLPMYVDMEYKNDIIWVSKNYELNRFFTYFLPPHAIMYENCCERINGDGLMCLLLLITFLTLPTTLIMSLIGAIVSLLRFLWKLFCKSFARE